MKSVKDKNREKVITTWEEKSGLLEFLSTIPIDVARFNDSFGFDIHPLVIHPSDIDGDKEMVMKLGFVLERYNALIPELTYCLYSLLREEILYGYVGVCKNGSIKILRELKPITDFKTGELVLHEWLGQLVKVSCEKIMP
jgi:hypothetical protein